MEGRRTWGTMSVCHMVHAAQPSHYSCIFQDTTSYLQ
jgi:hypothetical protein